MRRLFSGDSLALPHGGHREFIERSQRKKCQIQRTQVICGMQAIFRFQTQFLTNYFSTLRNILIDPQTDRYFKTSPNFSG